MIIFQTIKYKNFLSCGDYFIEIPLDKDPTTLVVGNNGSGKSTMLDALTFALFGKSFRGINKPQLLNSTNERECIVELVFSIGNTDWKIVRGMKPTIFEIHKNGKLVDQQASASDQQKILEQSILKMNYKSFTQLVVLGSSNFVPFMQLTAASRREVIEDLLDIKIFSSMSSIIKESTKKIKDELNVLQLKEDSLSDKYNMQLQFINKIESQGKDDITQKKSKIKQFATEASDLIESNLETNKTIESLNTKMKKFESSGKTLMKFTNLKAKINQKKETFEKEERFFSENSVCPTCTQNIEESFRLNKIDDLKSSITEFEKGLEELQTKIVDEDNKSQQFAELSGEVVSLTHEISQNNIRISGLQNQCRNLQQEIQTITNQLESRNSEHEKLENFSQNLKTLKKEITSNKELIQYYNFCQSLLKDGGVKTQIIKKYLPLINQQVNRYLQMMDFYINFTLDEEFNETVQSPIHEDFTYSSFSEGEKSRINLSLLFAWREVAKIKNSLNCNLIIFDETFDSSLDGFGADEFMKIIRYVISDANVFVISHKDSLKDKFENVIKFEKRKNFSYKV